MTERAAAEIRLGGTLAAVAALNRREPFNVHRETEFPAGVIEGIQLGQRPRPAACRVVRVFDDDQTGPRLVHRVSELRMIPDQAPGKPSVVTWQPREHRASQCSATAGLVAKEMSELMTEYLLTRPYLAQQRDDIGHGRAGYEDCRFLTEDVREFCF